MMSSEYYRLTVHIGEFGRRATMVPIEGLQYLEADKFHPIFIAPCFEEGHSVAHFSPLPSSVDLGSLIMQNSGDSGGLIVEAFEEYPLGTMPVQLLESINLDEKVHQPTEVTRLYANYRADCKDNLPASIDPRIGLANLFVAHGIIAVCSWSGKYRYIDLSRVYAELLEMHYLLSTEKNDHQLQNIIGLIETVYNQHLNIGSVKGSLISHLWRSYKMNSPYIRQHINAALYAESRCMELMS